MIRILCAGIIALAMLQPAPASASGRNDVEAENFIRDFTDKITLIIQNKNKTLAKRHEDIRELLLANVDVNRVGVFMLGRYARKIKRSEMPQYIELLKNYALRVFVGRMLAAEKAHTAKIKILQSTKKGSAGKEAIVLSQLYIDGLDQPIQVRWWIVRDKKKKSIKIFNIGVEGFWLAQEQRAVFTSLIQKNNGDPKIVLSYLSERIKNAEKNPPHEK